MFAGMPIGLIVVDTTGQNWQLVQSTSTVDHTSVEACAGNPNLRWAAYSGGGGGGVISGGTTGASLAAAVVAANAAGGGITITLGKGTYSLTAQLLITADGISIIGNGPGSTFLQIDDAGGMAGADAIKLASVLQFAIKGCTISSTAARTSGNAILVLGRNNITAQPAQQTRQYTIEDVDMQDQFNGVAFNDGPASQGCWGGYVNRGTWIRFSAGGTALDVNAPLGGQHYISNMKLYNGSTIIDANRAKAGVRYRGGADIEMVNINTIYFQNGLRIDPPNGQSANVVTATACLWDNNSQASVLVAPQAGGTVLGVELNGGWANTPPSFALPTIQIDGGEHIKVLMMNLWTTYQGVRISGPAKLVSCIGTDASGASNKAFYATNNASDFTIANCRAGTVFGVGTSTGITIDAGCDHFNVQGNNTREASVPVFNSAGTLAGQRIFQDNIIT